MSDVALYLGICIAGYIAAIPLRNHKEKLAWTGPAQTISVLFLVFVMGLRIGANDEIVKNLGSYGIYALVITFFTLAGSILCVFFVRKLLKMDRYGLVMDKAAIEASKAAAEAAKASGSGTSADDPAEGGKIDSMTIMIVGCVTAGILCGFFICRNLFDFEGFNAAAGTAITIGLCILLIFVGLGLGLDGQVINNFKSVGLKIVAIPIAIASVTLAGGVVAGLILAMPVNESVAVSAGLAWYSLGSAILLDAGLVSAGAISFMHNVMRELCAIIFIPIVAKKLGYVEALALPASPAMDVCLPLVERSTSGTVAVYSFISGFVLSMAVPFLVPLFI